MSSILTSSEARLAVRNFLNKGFDHVCPHPMFLEHEHYGHDVVPAAFVFDGSSGVIDLCLPASSRHDYGYLVGAINGNPVPKVWWDRLYRDIHMNHGMRVIGRIRYAGLRYVPPTCWISKGIWNRARKRGWSVTQVLKHRCLPDPQGWLFPKGSWMLKDAIYIGDRS
jgi:hypothetical protein